MYKNFFFFFFMNINLQLKIKKNNKRRHSPGIKELKDAWDKLKNY